MSLYRRFFACFRLDVGLERRTITSISETSARGSLILRAKCQIPVGPDPVLAPEQVERERNVGPYETI